MSEAPTCEHEEDFNHLRELLDKSNQNARRLWDWLSDAEQQHVLYEFPEMRRWIQGLNTDDQNLKPSTTS
jgi:hypothetical protein